MTEKTGASALAEIRFEVPSMVCNGCAEKVRNALTAVPGVRKVTPKLWHKQVYVRYEPATVEANQIRAALGAAGFETAEI